VTAFISDFRWRAIYKLKINEKYRKNPLAPPFSSSCRIQWNLLRNEAFFYVCISLCPNRALQCCHRFNQGDQIRWIFAFGAIFYFGEFLKFYNISPIFVNVYFYTEKKLHVNFDKNSLVLHFGWLFLNEIVWSPCQHNNDNSSYIEADTPIGL
jgi:hypothetical protein